MTITDPVVHLAAGGTSLVIATDGGELPRILHWGEFLGPLTADDLAGLLASSRPVLRDSVVSVPQPVPVLAQLATGWLGRPGLLGDSGGTRWAPCFRHAVYTAQLSEAGQSLSCTAIDPEYALELTLTIEVLEAGGVVRQRAELRNTDATPYEVQRIELAFPLPNDATEVLDFTGRWARERSPQRLPLNVGEWVRESRGGKPGLENTLLTIAGESGFGARSGVVRATHLAWSGNQVQAIERTPSDVRRLTGAETLAPGEVVLGAGESYATPWFYGSWGVGLDEVQARFHAFVRSRPQHPGTRRPVIVNTWEAVYFDHDLDTLLRLAEAGAAAGAERFVLDDGWFTGRRDDTTSLGDWQLDDGLWPAGLNPLVERVRELGMEFGLWFEPEMVNLDSRLAREHPEWIFDAGHGAGPSSRFQHVLDLGHEEAYEHVFAQISGLVDRYSIDYIKWDHNRYLLDAGHTPSGRAGLRRQTLQAYRMMAQLKAEHSGLEIESCASGGGRVDLGVLEFTDRVWPSDCNDPHERAQIQRWTGLLLPPELQGTHIGAHESHTTHRAHPVSFRGEKAIWGHLGLEVDLLELGEAELAAVTGWIAFHKANRELLHSGVGVHADLGDPALRLEGVVSADRSEALYGFTALDRSTTWPNGRIRFPGLDDARRYRVSVVAPGETAAHREGLPPWARTDAAGDGFAEASAALELPGAVLRAVGVEAPALDPDRSVLIRVVAL
ncbi:alpha-galactosidase [Compostimonas suwonensis]|uniref:alpha-galactosidase n=1 Tax=Compostimonas suwonensis TaxID=1048394 RepID=A0A2M9BVL9_9MICO|nr:alpha-galactosidase [Compostimonas suwonensis]PJJ61998.1 alpha-galactosidase [Compostimonas suwonensis]